VAIDVIQRPDHTYEAPGGILLPGITSRLKASNVYYEFSGDFADTSKGNRVHAAIHYAIEGDLKEESVDPEEIGYVRSALKFIEQEKIEVIKAEYAVGTLEFGYATKIDLYCRWRGKPTVVNWKTGGVYRAYAIQSALEALIFSPEPHERLGVHLSVDGLPKLKHYTDRSDYAVAKAALTVAGWVKKGA